MSVSDTTAAVFRDERTQVAFVVILAALIALVAWVLSSPARVDDYLVLVGTATCVIAAVRRRDVASASAWLVLALLFAMRLWVPGRFTDVMPVAFLVISLRLAFADRKT